MDQALPLLGLFAWNVRQLAQVVSDREKGIRSAKLSPFLVERFNRWARSWKLDEILELQSALAEVDFGIKQTPKLPLGLWTSLVSQFT
jgi:DNA polymerase III delta subunit